MSAILDAAAGAAAEGASEGAAGALKALASRLDFAALLDQRGRLLKLQSALPELALIPERLVLREAVGQPFEMVADCLSTSRHFELKQLIGEQLTVSLLQSDGSYAPWHGYVFEAGQLGADGGLARWRLVMRPWLGFLALRTDSFVYQDQSAAQILEAVFADHASANFELHLAEPLRTRSLCIQYNESDLDFVLRLVAEEGLSLRFEQLTGDAAQAADKARQARHKLIVSDPASESGARPDLGSVRFAAQHVTANLAEQKDAITAFEARRAVGANAVALGSWNYKQLAGTAGEAASALALGELPTLEVYDGAGSYRYADAAHAERAAELALAALELDFKRFEGQGSVRHLTPGAQFTLIDHALYGANMSALNYAGAVTASRQRPDNAFVLLAVEHHASNNLGSQVAQLLGSTALERGTYKNHFHAAPAAAALVPRFVRKPTAPGMQTALVVGVDSEPLTTERDLRVKVQFPWQRGERPLQGGLAHDASSPDAKGNAPGSETSGTWTRLAWPSAGANWGSALVPRVGTEVVVQFVEGDIDRPVIAGQLYNGADSPPFSAGVDSGVNHPGVISGLHSHTLNGAGFNQWVMDDATGQLRMRLLSSHAGSQLNLGHLIQQGSTGANRGAWRGSGFELATAGWASVRAGKGVLISTTTRQGSYGSAQGTQMDAAEALAQLKGAKDLGTRLDEVAKASGALGLKSHTPDQALAKFIDGVDPKKLGKHAGAVNGQQAMKAAADGRTLGSEPVEAFDKPIVMLDTPSTLAFATEASVMALAGQDTSLTAQGDLHQAAAHTYASASGQTTSLFTYQGGVQAYAANGPFSLRAHTDELQICADKAVTVISVNDQITIQAKTKIELVGGQSKLLLEGGNVTFSCPGLFEVKSSTHAFLEGGSKAAKLNALPQSKASRVPAAAIVGAAFNIFNAPRTSAVAAPKAETGAQSGTGKGKLPEAAPSLLVPPEKKLDFVEIRLHNDAGVPVSNAPYEVTLPNGRMFKGKLDADGFARIDGVPSGECNVRFPEHEEAGAIPERQGE
jgi:type VI secretion system secreted protein VgrG